MPATPDSRCGNLLAFDYGTRTIGVAIGNRLSASARALTTLARDDWTGLDALVADWRPEHFVIGLPLALDGTEQAMTRAARGFAGNLRQRYGRPVDLVDERYTSGEAARLFAIQRASGAARRKDSATIDALAARVILEAWFAETAAHAP